MNKTKSDLRQARQILALYKYLVGEAHETYRNLQRQERAATRRVRELEGRLKECDPRRNVHIKGSRLLANALRELAPRMEQSAKRELRKRV